MVETLAREFAKARSGGNVYMSGSHNPVPTEYMKARQFLEPIRLRIEELETELLKATIEKRRISDPDGCFGPDDWAHNRCTDACPPHGLVEPHGSLPRNEIGWHRDGMHSHLPSACDC